MCAHVVVVALRRTAILRILSFGKTSWRRCKHILDSGLNIIIFVVVKKLLNLFESQDFHLETEW